MNTNKYETIVIFEPTIEEGKALDEQIEKIKSFISANNGSVSKVDVWGKRELSHAIKKRKIGMYVVLVYSGDSNLVALLRRQLGISDVVLRSLTVEKDRFAPDFDIKMKEAPAASEELDVPATEEELQEAI